MMLLNASDAARQLCISVRAVYDLADAGLLACYRPTAGRRAVRFAQADLDAYIAACRSTSTKRASAGASSSRVSLKDADAELRSYFQRAGHGDKLKRTPASATPISTPLRLVPSESSR